MAFTSVMAGDRYLDDDNVKPRVPKSGYTPAVGDLVIQDTSITSGVDLITTNEAPYGIVESLNVWSSTATTRPISVAEFTSGAEIELPYTGTVNLGDKVVFSNTHGTVLDRTRVLADNVNGVGTVIAKDANTMHGTGHCVVRFTGQ